MLQVIRHLLTRPRCFRPERELPGGGRTHLTETPLDKAHIRTPSSGQSDRSPWAARIALGRKNSLFAGSDGGARHWAIVASLVATAKLNGVEPLAWLTDVLERMVSGRTKAHELERLLPWAWQTERLEAAVDI